MSITSTQIAGVVKHVREKNGDRPVVVGIHTDQSWDGGDQVEVDGDPWMVRTASSLLEFRQHLVRWESDRPPTVILTPINDQVLGHDLRGRLVRNALLPIERWSLVRGLFGVKRIDQRLARRSWMADYVIENVDPASLPAVPSGVLTLSLVLDLILGQLTGRTADELDAQGLLGWALDPSAALNLRDISEDGREDLAGLLHERAGEVAPIVFGVLASDEPQDAVPLGLACAALFPQDGKQEQIQLEATVRLESRTGNRRVSPQTGLGWAAAARAVLAKQFDQNPERARDLARRADTLLEVLGAAGYAGVAPSTPNGFSDRMRRLGRELRAALTASAADLDGRLAAVDSALAFADAHDWASRDGAVRLERARMAVRLVRWRSTQERAIADMQGGDLLARWYAEEGGWMDRARAALLPGDPVDELRAGYDQLLEAVFTTRDEANERFAKAVAASGQGTVAWQGTVLIERVLDEVVAPLARLCPVLLLVMDGMGVAVSCELEEDLAAHGWARLCGDGAAEPVAAAIAAIPSTTGISRTSLLSGRLVSGNWSHEKRAFQEHAGLVESGAGRGKPTLFHKAVVTSAGKTGLGDEVRSRVSATQTRVVGVVINAVDDHLSGSDQINIPWRIDSLVGLHELLEAASEANRALVMVSDHGHVLERGSKLGPRSEHSRYRIATGPPASGEIRVKGERVVEGGKDGILAAWSEKLRYSDPKTGYHGGVSLQEMLCPLSVWVPQGVPIEGWKEAPPPVPAWWNRQPVKVAPRAPAETAPEVAPVQTPTRQRPQGALFGPPGTKPAKPTPSHDWLQALFSLELFTEQLRISRRQVRSDDVVRTALTALAGSGGVMLRPTLAQALDLPLYRLDGFLSGLQRILNLDGYGVLEIDRDADTVRLNLELLRVQFDIPST